MPIIDWNYRFQRPQQLVTQFARSGHRVFYLATTLQRGRPQPVIKELAPNVWSVRLAGPTEVNIYRDELTDDLRDGLVEQLGHLREEARIDAAMSIVDLPFWGSLALRARSQWGWKVVYDCMDDHAGFVVDEDDASSSARQRIHDQEAELVERSDLVLATSRMLHEKLLGSTRKLLLVPNAADFEHFNRPRSGPLPASMPRPIIGYYGAISSWFDAELIAHAARERPAWSFVLAGSTVGADLDSLEGLANVHLLGEMPYELVAGLLHQFDVACIPFKLNSLTLATNPVKFYEYVSAGKPVVSVKLPELAPYEGYYYAVQSTEDFVDQLERALAEDSPELREERIELGRRNTWETRFRSLVPALRQWYKKATIIIPSFNNSAYLHACLESIAEKTEYPNYEVIVVDNGSDESLLDALAARSEKDPRLRLIANGENLGFAAANNVAIAAATDADYIVLLNDDTVVTRGWLGRLIGHLNDEKVGLVGPVTNMTGNEARIPVPYGDDLTGLEEFAARRTEEHHGKIFDIPVLAMYCVVMRKELVDRIGGLDERFKIGMFEDDDFAMRVRAEGLRVACAEDVFVHHWGRASFKRMDQEAYGELFEQNKRIFEEIWSQSWVPHKARG
jgi:GT2 family glycosyltransferase